MNLKRQQLTNHGCTGFVIVGGKGGSRLRTVELLTEQLEEVDCSIPDLPFGICILRTPYFNVLLFLPGRYFHTVSLFDAETLVVCGGRNTDLDCISWSREDSNWRPFATLRFFRKSTFLSDHFTARRERSTQRTPNLMGKCF